MLDTTDPASAYATELIDEGLLLSSGVPGIFGRSGSFEAVHDGLDRLITRLGGDESAETMRFPPTMSLRQFEASGYMRGFPHLAGTIHCFCGDERAHRALLQQIEAGTDWTKDQRSTGAVLTPAACYPVYPVLARRGTIPLPGCTIDVASWCFRHEPSNDPARMQAFRMREFVRVGTPEGVRQFRQRWLERAPDIAAALQLEATVDVANDPFFGRTGRLKADSQRELGLKFELLIPVGDAARPTACMSFNYHQDLFGTVCGLKLPDGRVAHTACVGFGMERLTLALFRRHGFDVAHWPDTVRRNLAL